jgi:hypothetical protein
VHWSVLVLVGACRFGFDPIRGDDAPGGGGGDGGTTSGDATDGSMMSMIDAQPAACAEATTVTTGITTLNTCGGNDRIDGCAGAAKQEIVIHFRPTVSAGYTIAAYDVGTQNVSNSTARVNADCASIGSCAGVTGTSLTAGMDYYFVVEASSGACVDIDFSIQ